MDPYVQTSHELVAKSEKSPIGVIVLAVLLGTLGGHNFYAGNSRNGGAQLGLSAVATIFNWFGGAPGDVLGSIVGGVVLLWIVVDVIMVITGTFTDGFGLPVRFGD
ncbi:MAG: NINE protein [Corynebacterium sp.]|nr:NINE protein [Corynebacterium sp.]